MIRIPSSNKHAKFAVGNAIGSVVLYYVMPLLGLIFSLIAIGLGVKALHNYKKDNSIGGKFSAIFAIIVGLLVIVIFIMGLMRAATQAQGPFIF